MDALGIARAHYLGYSMGAWIGFGLAGRAPERFLSMALGGAHPYFESGAAFHGVDGSDPEALIAAMERFVGNPMTPERQAQIRASDTRALAAAMHDRASQEHVLPAMTMPCLLYSGGNDPRHDKIEQCAARMPNARFVSFPGHTHSGLNMRADIVLPALMAFWNEVGVVQS
jgi:pimeloyl-ACP methyl ester carboxylesterase